MVVFTIYGQIWVMNADGTAHQSPPALLGGHDQLTTWMQMLALEGAAHTWEPKRAVAPPIRRRPGASRRWMLHADIHPDHLIKLMRITGPGPQIILI
jgi:hypothetical protein